MVNGSQFVQPGVIYSLDLVQWIESAFHAYYRNVRFYDRAQHVKGVDRARRVYVKERKRAKERARERETVL